MNMQEFFNSLGSGVNLHARFIAEEKKTYEESLFVFTQDVKENILPGLERAWKISGENIKKNTNEYAKKDQSLWKLEASGDRFLSRINNVKREDLAQELKELFAYVLIKTLELNEEPENKKNISAPPYNQKFNNIDEGVQDDLKGTLEKILTDETLKRIKDDFINKKPYSSDALKIFINAYTVVNPNFVQTSDAIKDIFKALMEKEYAELCLNNKYEDDKSWIVTELRARLQSYGFDITEKKELIALHQSFLRDKEPGVFEKKQVDGSVSMLSEQGEADARIKAVYIAGREKRAAERKNAEERQNENLRAIAEAKNAAEKERQQVDRDLQDKSTQLQRDIDTLTSKWYGLDNLGIALQNLKGNSKGTATRAIGEKAIADEVSNLIKVAVDQGLLEPIKEVTVQTVQQQKNLVLQNINELKKDLRCVNLGMRDIPLRSSATYTPARQQGEATKGSRYSYDPARVSQKTVRIAEEGKGLIVKSKK